MSVEPQVDAVRRRVVSACERAGRDPSDVVVVAVTKYVDVEAVRSLVAAGVADVGESQAQQLRDRAPLLPEVRWHFIGPLQTNKARYVARWATAFHALDRLEVAEALSARRASAGLAPLPCYVQVNVAGEATKTGVDEAGLAPLLGALAEAYLPGLEVVGLMTMPPLPATPEDSRPWFRRLATLAAEHGLDGLSMGTSADFEVAIEEGATAIRVGTVFLEGEPTGEPSR